MHWNDNIKLILSDIDEPVADVYMPADPEIINELDKVLSEGIAVFFIIGGGLRSIQSRVTNKLKPVNRVRVLIAHCTGAEVWGFDKGGNLREKPFYSVYEEKMNTDQKLKWRSLVQQLIREFNLKTFPTMPVEEFKQRAGNDPLSIMLADRGPQITLEFVNGYDLTPEQAKEINIIDSGVQKNSYDLRIPVLERAEQLLREANLPIGIRLGGVFALDMPVGGVSKEHAVKFVLESDRVLETLGLKKENLSDPESLEIWGDKYSEINGGTDRHMSLAVNPKVRSIDFRKDENPKEFPKGLNIQIWDGRQSLHNGLLEYLKSQTPS